MSKINLFCLPYAGGSSVVFNEWSKYLLSDLKVKPVELAGRGKRIREPFYQNLDEAVDDVFQIISESIRHEPYMIFGHSMGSWIAYQLVQEIYKQALPRPLCIFFSGAGAPHLPRRNHKIFHLMDDEKFEKEVLGLGGTPPEIFKYPELKEIFLPVLKNDFRIVETQIWPSEIKKLDQNITVFLGKDDDLTAEQCDGWKHHTSQLCNIHFFEGGHFFLHPHKKEICSIMNLHVKSLSTYLDKLHF